MATGEGIVRRRGAGSVLSPAMLPSFVRSIVSATSKTKRAKKAPDVMTGSVGAIVTPATVHPISQEMRKHCA